MVVVVVVVRAKSVGVDWEFAVVLRLFMYTRNSKGPRTNLYGTPCLKILGLGKGSCFEFENLVSKLFLLSLRYDLFYWYIHVLFIDVNVWLTPWSSSLLEKLIFSCIAKKLTAFYWSWRFITTFTIACQLSISWTRLIQSRPLILFHEY